MVVDNKVLDSYVGTYELGPTALVVSRVGKALAIQQKGQATVEELFAETPTRFFERGSTTTFSFESDGGNVARLVVEAGKQRLVATRKR